MRMEIETSGLLMDGRTSLIDRPASAPQNVHSDIIPAYHIYNSFFFSLFFQLF